jgi:tetratricopeptide (TPR) repeat protein
MAHRTRVTGTRSIALWLLIFIAAVLVGGLIAGVLIVYPGYQRQQQLEAHYKACVAFQAVDDWDKAVAECAQSVAIDGAYRDVQARYAEVRANEQEAQAVAKAEQVAAEATRAAQAQAQQATAATATIRAVEVRYQRGLAYMNLGRWDEAKSELDGVLAVDPNYKDVYDDNLGSITARITVEKK